MTCPHPGCGASYSKQSNLNTHINNGHKGTRFVCSECNAFYTTKAAFVKHLSNEHEQKIPSDAKNMIARSFWTDEDGNILTDDEKTAKIIELTKRNEKKEKMIEKLQKKYFELAEKKQKSI